MSIERLLLALEAEGKSFAQEAELDVYIVTLDELAHQKGFKLLNELRDAGIRADMDYMDRKMKAQMKSADRFNAKAVIVIGEDEVEGKAVQLKNMADGPKNVSKMQSIIEKIKEQLK